MPATITELAARAVAYPHGCHSFAISRRRTRSFNPITLATDSLQPQLWPGSHCSRTHPSVSLKVCEPKMRRPSGNPSTGEKCSSSAQ